MKQVQHSWVSLCQQKPQTPVGDNGCHDGDYQCYWLTRAACFGL